MKIVHVIGSLDPALGGPPVVAMALASAQAGLGHDVHVVSYASARGVADTPGATMSLAPAVRLNLVPPPTPLERLTARQAKPVLQKVLAGADVAHLHGVWERIVHAAAGVARQAGVAYAVAPHGMLDPWSLARRRLKKRMSLALGTRRMLQAASFLHLLNADEPGLLQPLELRCPVEVLPNGIFPEQFASLPQRGQFRALRRELGDAPFILFLGRLEPNKGLDYLADAFDLIARGRPDVHLVVVGPDQGALLPFRQQIAAAERKSPGLELRTHVVGPLYGQEKLAALVDADVYCLPSRHEGFSVAVIEALACGLPVVISPTCHFPEVASAGAGEVVELNAPAIAAALQRILGDEAARRSSGSAGRRLVFERYTWARIAESSIAAYHRRITKPGRS